MQQGNKTTAPEIDFGEFAPATYAEWREAAVAALKGADFDKKLFTKLVEGIRSEERRVGKECRSRWSPYH